MVRLSTTFLFSINGDKTKINFSKYIKIIPIMVIEILKRLKKSAKLNTITNEK